MQPMDYRILFSQYLAICNQAIQENQGKFPFHQIWSAIDKSKTETIDVQIIDDYSIPHFRMKFTDNHLTESGCARGSGCCGGCTKKRWQVAASYLNDVVDNPERYIRNPAMINWEWLQPDEDYLSLQGNSDEHAEQL